MTLRDGYAVPPGEPGLGIEWDFAAIERRAVARAASSSSFNVSRCFIWAAVLTDDASRRLLSSVSSEQGRPGAVHEEHAEVGVVLARGGGLHFA